MKHKTINPQTNKPPRDVRAVVRPLVTDYYLRKQKQRRQLEIISSSKWLTNAVETRDFIH